MVLQIVLPEPRNDANQHRAAGGGRLVTHVTKYACALNCCNGIHDNFPAQNLQGSEELMRRPISANSFTESKIGNDSLFNFNYGKELKSPKVGHDIPEMYFSYFSGDAETNCWHIITNSNRSHPWSKGTRWRAVPLSRVFDSSYTFSLSPGRSTHF